MLKVVRVAAHVEKRGRPPIGRWNRATEGGIRQLEVDALKGLLWLGSLPLLIYDSPFRHETEMCLAFAPFCRLLARRCRTLESRNKLWAHRSSRYFGTS